MDYKKYLEDVPSGLRDINIFQTAGTKALGKLSIGFGLACQVGTEAIKFGKGKVLLVTDQNIMNEGLHKIILESLDNNKLEVEIFSNVEAEPKVDTAQKIQELARINNFFLVVGIGGGSVLDIAKIASIAANNPEDILEYMHGKPITNEGLPCILLPTTAGTGSEVSAFVVLSEEDRKLFISNPLIYPTIALVDPLLTMTMPPKVTAYTGLDALSHGIEGMISKPSPLVEVFSNKCVELVFKNLRRAFEKSEDFEARYNMSLAAVLGMMAYSQGGGLYAHSFSYILTEKIGLPHGLGCGITLPYTLIYNYEYIKPILNGYSNQTGFAGGKEIITNLIVLLQELEIPSSFKALGVTEEMLPDYARDLIDKYHRARNPRPMNLVEANDFVKRIWNGCYEC
ncbi:MAG: iron-containing alcohol dehydrogenase [Bacillota bacterium]|nr:iron-containing alcohol dehydrogenase [Bacillota bacterium]